MVKILLALICLLVAVPCYAGDTVLSLWTQVNYNKNYLVESQEIREIENPITGETEEQMITVYTVESHVETIWKPQVAVESHTGKYANYPCKWSRLAPVNKLKAGDVAVLDVLCPKTTMNDIKKGSDVVIDSTVDITMATKINTKLGTSLNIVGKSKEEATQMIIDELSKKAVVIEP